MSEKIRQSGPGSLPEFLQVCVQKGILDQRSAQRIELHRRSRGHEKSEFRPALMNDPPDSGLTFDNYMVCKGNSFAVELAKTVAYKSPSRLPYNPLYIYGDIGLGKTHLLSAIANAATDKDVLLVNTADLEIEQERAERLRSRAELREWLVSADILLVDDIQLCEGREDVQRDLFSVLNHMTRAQRWVVISSDVPPTHLAGVESRLLSRLRGGVIVSLQIGDKDERRNLIRLFLDERPMPEDVVDHLADRITDDVRRLKAVVTQLLTLHDGVGTPLTVDMANSVVPLPGGLPESPKSPEPDFPEPVPSELDSAEPVPQEPDSTEPVSLELDSPAPTCPELLSPEPAPATHDPSESEVSTTFGVQVSRFEDMLDGVEGKDREASAMRLLKKMLASAESKEEESLALQIALGERIRQLRTEKGDPKAIQQLEQALDLLREGKMEEAIRCVST